MKKLAFFFTIALSLYMGTPNWAQAEKSTSSVAIGFIPGGDPQKLKTQSLEFAQALQSKLNVSVNIYISKNYSGLVEAMKSKKVDFAFFSSMTYVLAEQQFPLKVLLKKNWNEPFYFSALISRQDSAVRRLEQVKGKKIAFVDENSSSGFLYPKAALKKNKLDEKSFKEVVFSGNHQASVRLLEEGKVDVAAVFSDDVKGEKSAWQKFSENKKIKYRVLWMSEPIPNDPFCVRQDFYEKNPKLTHDLMFALIEMAEEDQGKSRFSDVLGGKSLQPATHRQYQPVRDMVKLMNIEIEK